MKQVKAPRTLGRSSPKGTEAVFASGLIRNASSSLTPNAVRRGRRPPTDSHTSRCCGRPRLG
jgi:hypothetical protein